MMNSNAFRLLCMASMLTTVGCNQTAETETTEKPVANIAADTTGRVGLKMAFIYGDTINEKYNFLIDAEAELTEERKRIEDRLRRKLEIAEKRAQQLQQQAATMTQAQMQEAQLELQSLELDMQQFQEKLGEELRKREIELQKDYLKRVEDYLNEFNSEMGYDMIFNYQYGGNLLWVNKGYDVTDQILIGLNEAYAAELSKASESASEK